VNTHKKGQKINTHIVQTQLQCDQLSLDRYRKATGAGEPARWGEMQGHGRELQE